MSVNDALQAVEKASRIGVPFKVALPTYGSAVLCDPQGNWLDVISEDSARLPESGHLVEVMSSPQDALAMLKQWKAQRPPNLVGVVWYRVPVEGDKRNWSWPQFLAVIQGKTPHPELEARLETQAEGFDNIVIYNLGEGDGSLPSTILLKVQNVIAYDGAFGYNAKEVEHGLIFSAANKKPLAAGGRASIGWVRRENLKGAFSFQLGL
jgi:hypothetical protein